MLIRECPSNAELAELALGRLAPDHAEQVADHLDSCEQCRQMLDTSRPQGDTLVSALRRGAQADAFAREPAFEKGVAQLYALVTPDPAAESHVTPTLQDADTIPPDAAPRGPQPMPERFGRYRVIRPLGRGGMGAVYLAHDEQLGREVAIKVPHFSGDAESETLQRFYRESHAAARLRHPNICPVYDVNQMDGTHYIVMAYIPGTPLSRWMKTESPTPVQIAHLVRKLALALAEAHDHGIVHRDLKPSNIMIDRRGEPVVMDFGLAQVAAGAESGAERLTHSGLLLGTPAYMPPEQVNGEVESMGPACDVYSLGVILYELLAGRLPFQGPVAAVLGQIISREPSPPSRWNPAVDPALEAICLKAMSKSIEDRYASMEEFAAALEAYLSDSAVAASPTKRISAAAIPAPAGRGSRGRRWSRWIAAGVAGISLLLGAVTYRIVTDRGTLVVIIRDADVSARLEQDGLVIEDATNSRRYEIEPNDLKPLATGKYKFDERPGLAIRDEAGLDLAANEFKLVRGGIVRVHVTLEPPSEQAADVPPGGGTAASLANPDRRLAEWILKLGGKLYVYVGDNGIELTSPEQVPTDPFRVDAATLTHRTGVDAAGLANLVGTRVSALNFTGSDVTDEALQHVSRLMSLRDLQLGDTSLTSGCLLHLRELPKLERLFLDNTRIDDSGLENLLPIPSLNYLCVRSTAITDDGLETICRNRRIQTLEIGGTFVTDDGLRHLAKLPHLNVLSLQGSAIGAAGFANLKDVASLSRLGLGATEFADQDLAQLPATLEELGLIDTRIDDAGLKHLYHLSGLKRLSLDGTLVTLAGIRELQQHLPKCEVSHARLRQSSPVQEPSADRRLAEWALEMGGRVYLRVGAEGKPLDAPAELPNEPFRVDTLELNGSAAVDDAGLEHLRGTRLRALNLSGTSITDDGLLHLSDQSRLDDLWLSETRITNDGLEHLRSLPNLTRVALIATHVTDEGMRHLPDVPRLDSILLQQTAITDAAMEHLARVPNLQALLVGQTKVTDAGLVHLKHAKKLVLLSLEGSPVSAGGFRHLQQVPSLRTLSLNHSTFADADLKQLPSTLTVLEMSNTALGDEGLENLSHLTSLERLVIRGTQVTDAGVQQLQARLPKLEIIR